MALLCVWAALGSWSACWAGYGGVGPTDQEAAWVREHVGVYAWGRKSEKELSDFSMEEKVAIARGLGTRIIRDALTMYPEPWRRGYDPTQLTFIDQLRTPGWRALIEAFDVIILTLADGSGRQFDPAWTRPHFQALTEYLLRTYADRDKTFILGNWEGDHWLKDPAQAVPLFRARQEGIAAGQAAAPGSRARVYFMLELVTLDYEGRSMLVNHTVPQTQADLYSLSAWRYLDELTRALDYIKTKAPDSAAFGRRNCMVGEASGGPNWKPETELLERSRRVLSQAREGGAPFVTWWELLGAENGLLDSRYDGGGKQRLYYWLYRAFHDRDDPLVVEDFEADPWSLDGSDLSADGCSLNRFGGRREHAGSAEGCLVRGGATGRRALYLRFGEGGGAWSTDLLRVETQRFAAVKVSLRGAAPGLAATLTDAAGHAAKTPCPEGGGSAQPGWRECLVPIAAKSGALAVFALSAAGPGEVWVDDLALVGPGRPPRRAEPVAEHVPQAADVALAQGDQLLALPGADDRRLTRLRLVAGRRLARPTVSDGRTSVTPAEELLPGEVLEIVPGGTSHLRLGPLRRRLDVAHPEACGLIASGLSRQPQFHCLLPADRAGEGRLEWRHASAFPITHFRIAVYGNVREKSAARLRVPISADGREWTEAPVDERAWDESFWVARPPQGFQPTRELWVRVQPCPDPAPDDWQWTISLGDIRAELWMDTESLTLPSLRGLRYTDGNAAAGFRGLMDLDW